MSFERNAKNRWMVFVLLGIVVFLVGANCTLGRMLTDQVHEDSTNTSYAFDTNWSKTFTQEAKDYNYMTATSWQETDEAIAKTSRAKISTEDAQFTSIAQTDLAPKPPIITGVNFPAEIPGNKSTIIGLLYFTDADGDISHIVYDVVSATQFGGGTDSEPKLDSGNWTNGAVKIYLWCEGQQTVTLQATIFDRAGNKSNSMSFTFTCK